MRMPEPTRHSQCHVRGMFQTQPAVLGIAAPETATFFSPRSQQRRTVRVCEIRNLTFARRPALDAALGSFRAGYVAQFILDGAETGTLWARRPQ